MSLSTFSFPTTILFGPGAIEELPKELAKRGIKRPLLVTDAGLERTAVFERVSKLARSAYSVCAETLIGLDVGEAGLAWITALGYDPIDLVGGGIEPRLDAAVPVLDDRFADEFGGRGSAEIISTSVLMHWKRRRKSPALKGKNTRDRDSWNGRKGDRCCPNQLRG